MPVHHSTRFVKLALALTAAAATLQVRAYPEFQQQIVKSTGRAVNCALCHANADGPEGTGPC